MENREKAIKILKLIGGENNITGVTHCMTRLRITPKDRGLIEDEKINDLDGIIGTKTVGSQYQIIVGTDVENVYNEFTSLMTSNITNAENKNIEGSSFNKEPKQFSFKKIVESILDVIAACVSPLIPIITAAGLVKLIAAVISPAMLGIVGESSDVFRLLTFVGDAGFYYFPVFVAYASAKKFKVSIPMALFIAGILLHPALISIVSNGENFTVFGIPMFLTNYASNFISMILITWIMSYVEKFLDKLIPNSLRSLLFPLLTLLIMLPLALCILGPIGAIFGNGIAEFLVFLNKIIGPFSIAIIGAFWPLLIVTGMHQALIAIALSYIATMGSDNSILVGAIVSNYALMAISLAFLLRTKNNSDKSNALASFITLTIGGISEPTLFGIILKHKKAILYILVGGFIGGFYAGLMKVAVYFAGTGNITSALGFAGDNPSSLLQGIIACIISFLVTFILAFIFGFEDKKEVTSND